LFLACLFLAPIAGMVPAAATAPALIVVGILMAESLGKIKWAEFEIAVASFLTVVLMPFAYSISTGVAGGFIFYCVAKIVKGKAKEVHPILYIVTGLFILSYVINAIM
jgi:adenine/guanine/hypoxanthine permease